MDRKLEAVIALEDSRTAEELKKLLSASGAKKAEIAESPHTALAMIHTGKFNALISSLMFTGVNESYPDYITQLPQKNIELEEDIFQSLTNGKMSKARIACIRQAQEKDISSQEANASQNISGSLVELTLSEEEKTRIFNKLAIQERKALTDKKQRFAYGLDLIETADKKNMNYVLVIAPPEDKNPFFIEYQIRQEILAWMMKQKLIMPAEAYRKGHETHFSFSAKPEKILEQLTTQTPIPKKRYSTISGNWTHLYDIMNIGMPQWLLINPELKKIFERHFFIAKESIPLSGEEGDFAWEVDGDVYIRNCAVCFDARLTLSYTSKKYLGKKAVFHIGTEKYTGIMTTKTIFTFPDPLPQQNFIRSEVIGIEFIP